MPKIKDAETYISHLRDREKYDFARVYKNWLDTKEGFEPQTSLPQKVAEAIRYRLQWYKYEENLAKRKQAYDEYREEE